jgi:DNA-directed RNA polymerase subunit M/transcription elongation factor TFIIS
MVSVPSDAAAANAAEEASDIQDTDIVFDCPNCGKSLAVDRLGAGMMIPCSDCGKLVQVPAPEEAESSEEEGEEPSLADADRSTEMDELRRKLAAAESRVRELEALVEEVNGRREVLEKARADTMFRFGLINEKAGVIREALDEITRVVRSQASTP